MHPRIRVTLPLEDDQVQFANPNNPRLIDSSTTTRLLTSVPSLVFAPPVQPWPQGVVRPEHWLRTDLPGLLPYVGAGGDEHDVRTWAFLAFLRRATYVMWNSPLPIVSSASEPADPNELIWFYPGSWFGVDEPVPTVQLKWLRRAEQDFEYLYLAKERGEEVNAQQMARLITKPVEIQPGEAPDPTYSLMSGTTDPRLERGGNAAGADGRPASAEAGRRSRPAARAVHPHIAVGPPAGASAVDRSQQRVVVGQGSRDAQPDRSAHGNGYLQRF